MLSFALFLMVLIHGLKSGTDSQSPWALALYWGSGASVLLGSVYRVVAVRKGRAKEAIRATGLIAVGGRARGRARTEGGNTMKKLALVMGITAALAMSLLRCM